RRRAWPRHRHPADFGAHGQALMRKQGEQVVETAVEARAGFLDRPVLAVLIVSAVLAAAFLAVSYFGVI
ncbi:MAG: hypothetical protein ABWY14_02130, partial [Tardiphaga sp.]